METNFPKSIDKELCPADLNIQYSVLAKINRPESCVDIVVSMTYITGSTKLFSGGLTTRFEVVELSSFIEFTENSSEFQIKCDFLPMLINIAFGTTRGYIAHELKDTLLAPYPFPMIARDNILKNTAYQII